MVKDFSFDIESDFDMMEMTNALDQTKREISQRYDFKGTDSAIDFDEDKKGLVLLGDSDYKVDAMIDIIESKMVKRGLSLKILDKTSPKEYASGNRVRQKIAFKKGMDKEKAKKITKTIRDAYPKVKAQVQGEAIRVSSGSKDDLQGVMQILKSDNSIDIPLQFTNYR
ncbi:YajQ family cyclic di-GMP-binding protein [candidate division WS5 bacterium]|uniref:Nucleotide-binding protein C4544_02420 n=1 Tax=candidate division WS5 bacterium TaxID=2093353 RepID=A0A419DEP8_9BACT|nr:MAG: YajQ family cyclic di-GMP-binding protein [candidate division WS5 bacterium]